MQPAANGSISATKTASFRRRGTMKFNARIFELEVVSACRSPRLLKRLCWNHNGLLEASRCGWQPSSRLQDGGASALPVLRPPVARETAAGCDSRRPGAGVRRCTSERHKTHVTEAVEVLYPWHSWFGRIVYIHEVIERGGERIFRCDLDERQTARCIHIPAWMFDRVACLRVRRADTPQVELAALICLKALLAEVANRTSAVTAVVGARHRFENRGDADAKPQSTITDRSTQSVPIVEPTVTGLAMPVGRSARERDTPNCADAQQTRGLQSSRPRRRRPRR